MSVRRKAWSVRHKSSVILLLGTMVLALAACGAKEDATADTLTQRERDSAIGASSLPGARGVSGALRAVDSANARNAALDSIGEN